MYKIEKGDKAKIFSKGSESKVRHSQPVPKAKTFSNQKISKEVRLRPKLARLFAPNANLKIGFTYVL